MEQPFQVYWKQGLLKGRNGKCLMKQLDHLVTRCVRGKQLQNTISWNISQDCLRSIYIRWVYQLVVKTLHKDFEVVGFKCFGLLLSVTWCEMSSWPENELPNDQTIPTINSWHHYWVQCGRFIFVRGKKTADPVTLMNIAINMYTKLKYNCSRWRLRKRRSTHKLVFHLFLCLSYFFRA